MGRIVSVWLPDWPITAWSRAAGRTLSPEGGSPKEGAPEGGPPEGVSPEGQPFVLVETLGGKGLALHAVNAAARAMGLHRGQSHADARAILPDLQSAPAEPDAAAAALVRIALWAERYSPAVAIDQTLPEQDGLFLDMTGAAHLFGGEAALLAEMEARFAQAGVKAIAAIADTPGAAWALARFGQRRLAAPDGAREALRDLPIEALRLHGEALRLLHRFGLRRVGDLYGLPRGGLARRFRGPGGAQAGLDLVRRFDQALGVEGEPLQPVRPAPLYRTWLSLLEPLIDSAGVGFVLPELAQGLCEHLERDGKGARRIRLTAFRTDGRATSLEAGLSVASAKPAHLIRLLTEKGLERLDLGFGADALMLQALKAEHAAARQSDFSKDEETAAGNALATLADRVEARLGEGAVRRPVLLDSHIPERSETWATGLAASSAKAANNLSTDYSAWPLFMFDPPEPIEATAELPDSAPARFIWRRMVRRVTRADGPDRVAPQWWRLQQLGPRAERTRDYYRVEDDAGRRYWLFREGLYERRTPLGEHDDRGREVDEERPGDTYPSWWIHGVFA